MIGWKFEFGTLSDLSATIFSVFLLLLVILLDSALSPNSFSSNEQSIERTPLGAAALADLLYQRRLSAQGTRIDILRDQVVVITSYSTSIRNNNAVPMSVRELRSLLQAEQLPEPVSIYVFSNDLYADVVDGLQNQGLHWREMSVPSALKQDGVGHWSTAFVALAEKPISKDIFIRDLAIILGGGVRKNGGAVLQSGTSEVVRYSALYESIAQSLRSMWTDLPFSAIINILFGLCGLYSVIWIERRFHPIRSKKESGGLSA